jgi:hypothetical protein
MCSIYVGCQYENEITYIVDRVTTRSSVLTGRGKKMLTGAQFNEASISWAGIQRRGSILTWIVILSVYGADTIAEVKLLISPFLC